MSQAELTSYNPASKNDAVGVVALSTKDEVVEAVNKSKSAYSTWRHLSIDERAKYFEKFHTVYKSKIAALAEMMSREMGKPIKQSMGEVESTGDEIDAYINIAKKMMAPDVVDESETQKNIVYFEPYGAVALILPWNYPVSLFVDGIAQIVLAGNTAIVKHSEENPLTSKMLQDICDEAGFPEGVIQTVYGDGKVGEMLVSQDIDMIHFTGSSRTGEALYKVAADKFIPIVLEMGGSSPGVVFDDANLEEVISCISEERFSNCGQICCALKRLFVHEALYDDVVQRLVEKVKAIKIGDPLDEKTDMGPLVAPRQLELIEAQVQDAIDKGVKVEIGASRPEGLEGAYYSPTVLTNVTKNMRVYTEETFGPVLTIMPFKTEEEAIELANDTPYGLSAFVYSQDIEKAQRVAAKIETGNVAINNTSYFSDHSPFGGHKRSGMGTGRGKYGFYQVTQMKTVSVPKR
jgi:succinate-semialdehyde dehydrogenase/glutarate-semialdehyde dehydrogenase